MGCIIGYCKGVVKLANKIKFSVSFTQEMMDKIDEYRSTNGLSRAGVIQHCVLKFFEDRDQMKMFPEMTRLMDNMMLDPDFGKKYDINTLEAYTKKSVK